MRNPFKTKAITFTGDPFTTTPISFLEAEFGHVEFPDRLRMSNADMYRQHPGVRAVIDTLARNVAQLPLHVFMVSGDVAVRQSPNNRVENLLRRPDPTMSGAQWKWNLVQDLAVHGEAIHLLVGDSQLLRFDPVATEIVGEGTNIDAYKYAGEEYPLEDVLHVRLGFDPKDSRRGLSPLASLRGLIAEDLAASDHRLRHWQGGTPGSWIERPLEAPDWGSVSRDRFIEEWKKYKADSTPVLEEGMELHAAEGSAKDSEYVAGREFVLRQIASVFGVPMQSVGGSDRNADSAHRSLYQDAIAPLTAIIEEGLNTQLVPRLLGPLQTVGGRIFCEFELQEKLRGSFREQSESFALATGGAAWLTPNNVRNLLNLPSVEGGDVLPATTPGTAAA